MMTSDAAASHLQEGHAARGQREGGGRHTAGISRWVDLGVPVHYVDHGGPAEGPLLVLVHGLGGSSVNWAALAPLLAGTCRALALDLPGFGLTKAGRQPTTVNA